MMTQKQFVSELGRLRPSATFLSILGYRNEASEVADYSIVFHMSYENALRRSLVALESVVPSTDYESIAKQELMVSYQTSLDKMATTAVEEIDDNYTRFFDEDGKYIKGVKLHTTTGTMHLYGLINHKRVLMPGQYKTSNRRPLTIAKDKMRRLCPVNKFRQFRITPEQVDRISVENLSLLPPSIE
jgi:hypothetical protein